MLTHESKPDLTLIQTLGQMLNELGYQLKLSSEIRERAEETARLSWASEREELTLWVDLDIDDAERVIVLTPGTQLGFELEFVFREIDHYGCFEVLETTVANGELNSSTMFEAHEDVGDEVATLIEDLATAHYHSGTH